MICHIVLIRFRPDISEDTAAALLAPLDKHELAIFNCDAIAFKRADLAAQFDELCTDLAGVCAFAVPGVCDGLVKWQ